MSIQLRKAKRLEKAIMLGEIALKRLNEDRSNSKRVRQAIVAMFLCHWAKNGKTNE